MASDGLFYDSLEEEEFPDLKSMHITSDKTNKSDISLSVPLYTRETSKAEVLSKKSLSSSQKSRCKLTKPMRSQQSNLMSSTTCMSQLFPDSKVKKSYVDLFHAKIGYVQGSEPTETSRAVCDDDSFKTARSSAQSDYSDAETSSFVSDTSFYTKFLENEKLLTDQMSSVSCQSEHSGRTVISKVSNANNSNLKSKCNSKISKSTTGLPSGGSKVHIKSKIDRPILKVPTLGGLGPDREAAKEKLDNLKKQQKYGQKVSNQNRVKIMEMKVMKNFKYELKKSSELNKCAESVLHT